MMERSCTSTLENIAAAKEAIAEMDDGIPSGAELRWKLLKRQVRSALRDFGRGIMSPAEKHAYQQHASDVLQTMKQLEQLIPE